MCKTTAVLCILLRLVALGMQLPAGQGQVNVDSGDIYAFDAELYKMLIKYPAEMITLMDDAVKLAYADATQQNAEDVNLQVVFQTAEYERAIMAPNQGLAAHCGHPRLTSDGQALHNLARRC